MQEQKHRWTYKFEDDNDLGDWKLKMLRKRGQEVARTAKTSSLLLEQHEATISFITS